MSSWSCYWVCDNGQLPPSCICLLHCHSMLFGQQMHDSGSCPLSSFILDSINTSSLFANGRSMSRLDDFALRNSIEILWLHAKSYSLDIPTYYPRQWWDAVLAQDSPHWLSMVFGWQLGERRISPLSCCLCLLCACCEDWQYVSAFFHYDHFSTVLESTQIA